MLSHTNADSHYRKGRLSGEDTGVRLLSLDDRDDGKGIYQCILRVLVALMRVEAVSDSPFGATAIVQGNRAKQYGVYSELRNPRRRFNLDVSRTAPFDRHTCLRKGLWYIRFGGCIGRRSRAKSIRSISLPLLTVLSFQRKHVCPRCHPFRSSQSTLHISS